jgi:hypothetical protein
MSPFSREVSPTELEEEIGSYMDPQKNNTENFPNGQTVKVTMFGETRKGFVAKQIDDRHFLVKLEYPFEKVNPGKSWLKVCRDYAHQCIEEV